MENLPVIIIGLLVFGGIPICLFCIFGKQVIVHRKILKSDERVIATIKTIRKGDFSLPSTHGTSNKHTQRIITFGYDYGGKYFEKDYGEETSDGLSNPFKGKTVSDSIEVYVNPDNPEVVAFDWGWWKKFFLYGGTLAFGLLSLLMIWVFVYHPIMKFLTTGEDSP